MKEEINNKINGFTLVELSIALVIIGLLVGGILVAQSLIESTKLSMLARDLGQYEVAVNNFRQKFRQYPGESNYFTFKGAPDNVLNYGYTNGDGDADVVLCNGIYRNAEYMQAWGQLSESNMVSDYHPYYSLDSCGGSDATYPTFKTHPYTEYTDNSGQTQRLHIGTEKAASSNYYFKFTLDPLDILALESKLGAHDDLSFRKEGLLNSRGVGVCTKSGFGFGPNPACNSSEAKASEIIYVLGN